LEEKYTKFEKARMISARSLQIAMGSPIFVDPKGEIDPIEIATMEYEQGTIPITVRRKTVERIPIKEKKVEEMERS
jgi:DNA-directed RNA polymerase subunit K